LEFSTLGPVFGFTQHDRRNIAISLIDRSRRVIAFHEKAGRSQVFFVFSLDKVFLLPSGPLSLPFHPHSFLSVFSLGASWVFSLQPVLPPDFRPLFPSTMEAGPGD
jgi:hypothetical protein